jgi:hypothetical protein
MAKYSLAEAANLLNISKQAVVLRIKRGALHGSKDKSGQWVVEIDEPEGPTGGQQEPSEGPTGGQQEPSEGPTGGQQEPSEGPTGGQQERIPRRENDDALLKNNEFLQLTTASNQELVARLTKSIEDQRTSLEDQKSRESKAWFKSSMIFGILVIGVSIYFINEKNQIKEEAKSLRDEMKLEHQADIESLGTKYQETVKTMETRYQESETKHQTRYQESESRYQEAKKDYQARYQETSENHQKKESLLQDQIEVLKTQNKELMELLKTSKAGNLN